MTQLIARYAHSAIVSDGSEEYPRVFVVCCKFCWNGMSSLYSIPFSPFCFRLEKELAGNEQPIDSTGATEHAGMFWLRVDV